MILDSARRLYRYFYPIRQAWRRRGTTFASQWLARSDEDLVDSIWQKRTSLETFFDARTEGPGIWKWRHYFEIYDRHFSPLRQREGLVILEVGIYSGGSLDLWRHYFGSSASIYGVDIMPACLAYQRSGTHILIGDQADRAFWRGVLADGSLPPPDIVIDDGGHTPEQQRVTMEELLPHLRPGGVYLCEDIHGLDNAFAAYVSGFASHLNGVRELRADPDHPHRRLVVATNPIQNTFHSVHLYPFVVLIEKRQAPLNELVAPKQGSQWEPFLR